MPTIEPAKQIQCVSLMNNKSKKVSNYYSLNALIVRFFVLEPEQVRAMKDAGFWDDPVKRAKMIKRYAEQSRNRG